MASVGAAERFNAPAGDVQAKVERLIARLRFELTHQDVRPDARALRDKLDLISKELTGIIAKQAEATSQGGRGWLDVFPSSDSDADRASWLTASSPDGHSVKSYRASGGTIEKTLLAGRFITPLQQLERRVASLESIAKFGFDKTREVEHG